jgi:hypothetical protein
VLAVSVLGRGGVPSSGVSAVTMNVTVTQPSASGYVTAYPCGGAPPANSSLNFAGGQSVSNLVTVGVGVGGQVCFLSYTRAHVIVDVVGWFGPGAGERFVSVTPTRFEDTRDPGGAVVAAGAVLVVPIVGRAPVPGSGVSAVSVNLTVVGSSKDGYITAYPCAVGRPDTSSVNFRAGQVIANHAVVPIGADGRLCIYAYSTTHVVVDVMGYYAASGGSTFGPIVPARLVDTRDEGAPLVGGQIRRLKVAGRFGVPATSTAVVLNVTAVDPVWTGYLTVFPCGATPPVSSVNFDAHTVQPNYVAVGLSGGDVCIVSPVTTHLLVDVSGAFS